MDLMWMIDQAVNELEGLFMQADINRDTSGSPAGRGHERCYRKKSAHEIKNKDLNSFFCWTSVTKQKKASNSKLGSIKVYNVFKIVWSFQIC